MRKRRTVTLTASATALTAGFVAMMAAASPVAPAGHAAAAWPRVAIEPGDHPLRAARTAAVPFTAACCERSLQIAGFEPDQLRAPITSPPVRENHHRQGRDDRHR
jgi:hypothetical protein